MVYVSGEGGGGEKCNQIPLGGEIACRLSGHLSNGENFTGALRQGCFHILSIFIKKIVMLLISQGRHNPRRTNLL